MMLVVLVLALIAIPAISQTPSGCQRASCCDIKAAWSQCETGASLGAAGGFGSRAPSPPGKCSSTDTCDFLPPNECESECLGLRSWMPHATKEIVSDAELTKIMTWVPENGFPEGAPVPRDDGTDPRYFEAIRSAILPNGNSVPVKIFDGECSGTEIRMYEGNGDNDGTTEQKVARCSDACQSKKTPLSGSWSGFEAKGFVVASSGRCYCESADSATCARTTNSYDRYDWAGWLTKACKEACRNNGNGLWREDGGRSRKLGLEHKLRITPEDYNEMWNKQASPLYSEEHAINKPNDPQPIEMDGLPSSVYVIAKSETNSHIQIVNGAAGDSAHFNVTTQSLKTLQCLTTKQHWATCCAGVQNKPQEAGFCDRAKKYVKKVSDDKTVPDNKSQKYLQYPHRKHIKDLDHCHKHNATCDTDRDYKYKHAKQNVTCDSHTACLERVKVKKLEHWKPVCDLKGCQPAICPSDELDNVCWVADVWAYGLCKKHGKKVSPGETGYCYQEMIDGEYCRRPSNGKSLCNLETNSAIQKKKLSYKHNSDTVFCATDQTAHEHRASRVQARHSCVKAEEDFSDAQKEQIKSRNCQFCASNLKCMEGGPLKKELDYHSEQGEHCLDHCCAFGEDDVRDGKKCWSALAGPPVACSEKKKAFLLKVCLTAIVSGDSDDTRKNGESVTAIANKPESERCWFPEMAPGTKSLLPKPFGDNPQVDWGGIPKGTQDRLWQCDTADSSSCSQHYASAAPFWIEEDLLNS